MFLKSKRIHGRLYYYAARTGRVDGHVRVVEQTYLGRLEDLVALKAGAAAPPPKTIRTRHYGAVAALWQLAQDLELVSVVDQELASSPNRTTAPTTGLSVGQYLLLAALNRAIAPRSKRGFAGWYAHTSLERLCPAPVRRLSSQRFWEAMNRLDVATCQRIFRRVAQCASQLTGVKDTVSCYDTTNFFTFIASDNGRPELPKRGHNKAHRNDLRQVSLALAVGGQTHLPLFYWVYGGEQPDVAQFREVWPRLQEQMAALGLDAATVVYDKGNVSQAAQEAVDTSGAHYVTSVVPSYFPDLLAVPLEQLTPVSVGQVEGLRAYRTQMKLLKRERTVVMTHSPVLAAGQLRGVQQHLTKAEAGLVTLQERLVRYRQQPRGRKPTREGVQRQVERLLAKQHLPRLLSVHLQEEDGHLALSVVRHQEALDELTAHLFGRRIWVTDQAGWSTEQIVATAHAQAEVEAAFARLHSPYTVAWQPMWHWTDQKIQVHALYCVLALLLVRLLQWQLRDIDHRDATAVLRDLDEIQECTVVYPPAGGIGRPRLVSLLNELTPGQQALVEALNLQLQQM